MTTPISAPSRRADFALLLLRLVAGIAFIVHGLQKVQMGVGNIAGFFGKAGVPIPGIIAPIVSYGELIGGILLIAGFFFRVLPWLFVIDMAGAIAFVHGKNGYGLNNPGFGFEYVLALLVICAALGLTGPGALSVDGMMRRR